MVLVGVAIVKNEADVLEAFVRHNLHYLDRLVVVDHASDDDTPCVLAELQAEGLPLTLRRMHDVAFDHAKSMTAALRMAAGLHPADAYFALDADEFLRCESPQALRTGLAALPRGRPGYLRWQTHVPAPRAAPGPPHVLRNMTLRLAEEPGVQHKVVLPQALVHDPDWRIETGNHWVQTRAGIRIDGATLAQVRLAHLPFRSPAQLVRKVALGWLGHRLALGPAALDGPLNWHWRGLYERMLLGRFPGREDLVALAASAYASELPQATEPAPRTVSDPLPVHAELRWPDLADIDPLLALLRWTDRLVGARAH